jgi:hypothetical protein
MDFDGVILVMMKEGISSTNKQITTVPMLSNKI